MATFYPAAGADDSYEVPVGTNTPGSSPIQVRATAGDHRISAFRFPLTGIAQGSSIISATLNCYFTSTSRDDIHCNIRGEKVTTPGQFTATAFHISGRLDANPTTASVEWDNTGSAVAYYTSPDISAVIQELVNQASWPDDGHVVLFLDPRAYTDGKFSFIASYEAGSNLPYLDIIWTSGNTPPTITPNTPDEATLSTLAAVEFTGTDADADDIRYQVQITNNPTNFSAGPEIIDEITSGSGTIIHPNPSGSLDWEGNQQCDDRLGMGFQGQGGILDSIDFYFGTDELGSTDGTYLVRVYEAAGYPVDPVPAAWAATTVYSVGEIVRPTSTANANVHFVYRCKVSGTSGSSEPAWPGNGVAWKSVTELGETADGSVTWESLAGLHPANPADPDDTPTPGWLAESDSYSFNPVVTTSAFRKCDFTGSDRIHLEAGKWYMAILQWRANSGVYENTINTSNASLANAVAPGNVYLDGPGTNNGARVIEDSLFVVRESYDFLDKVSGTDAGFANTEDVGDTDPFTSGEKIGYTVQAGDELTSDATYRWQARAIDPVGSNLWSDWTAVRTFTVTPPTLQPLAASISATTDTPAVTLTALRSLAAAIQAQTNTPAASLPVSRPLTAAAVAVTTTPSTAVAVGRALAGNTQGHSATPEIELSISGAIQLLASIQAVSDTPDAGLTVLRPFTGDIAAASETAVPDLSKAIALTADIQAVSAAEASLFIARLLLAAILSTSATGAATLSLNTIHGRIVARVSVLTPSAAVTVQYPSADAHAGGMDIM